MTDYTKLIEALRCKVGLTEEETKCEKCPYGTGYSDCDVERYCADAATAIEALQSQLPKRGEWIDRYDEDDKPFFKRKYVCSACSHWNTYGKSKYCPNCGAKMEVQDG